MKIKTRRYYIYYLARVGGFLLGLYPIRFASYIASFLSILFFYLLRTYRLQTLKNLRYAFGSMPEEELEKIARKVFSNMARNYAEYMNFYRINKNNIDLWVKPYGEEKVKRALTLGKGLIILTAHFGNWELVGAYNIIKGYEGAVIARRLYFYKYNNFIMRLRTLNGVETIYRDEHPKKVLKILRENKIIGVLADQDIDSIEGIFVNFFGKPTYTAIAPVKLAMASGAPIIPCFMIRKKNRYNLIVEEPIFVKKNRAKEEAVRLYTQKWTSVLESYIRRYPEQWVWMHNRWKTKPA